MIAALPMYDTPQTAPALDALWACIRDGLRAQGIGAPEALTRGGDVWQVWQSPALVLGQTCSLPFRARLKDQVQVLGAFDLGLPGTPPGYYHSVLVARADDPRAKRGLAAFRGARLAYNEALSQSGWAAPSAAAARAGFSFDALIETGAHRQSARAVAEGRADIAALDAASWRVIAREDPATAARLSVVGRTRPTPGLPLITRRDSNPAPYRKAIGDAVTNLSQRHRATLDLRGFVPVPEAAYLALPIPQNP